MYTKSQIVKATTGYAIEIVDSQGNVIARLWDDSQMIEQAEDNLNQRAELLLSHLNR